MSPRSRLFIAAPVLVGVLTLAVGWVLGATLASHDAHDYARARASTAVTALEQDRAALDRLLAIWAAAPETYRFVVDRDPEYARQQWSPDRLEAQGADLLLMTQPGASVIYAAAASSLTPRVQQAITTALTARLPAIEQQVVDSGALQGALATEVGAVLVAVRPIEGGTQEGRLRGLLLLARHADSAYLDALKARSGMAVGLYPVDPALDIDWPQPLPPGTAAAREGLTSRPAYAAGDSFDDATGYVRLPDLLGAPVVLVRADATNGPAAAAARVSNRTLLAFGLGGALVTALLVSIYTAGERRRIERVQSLSARITATDWSAVERLAQQGDDDIGRLAREIALLLNRLQVDMTDQIEAGRQETAQQLFGEAIIQSVAEGVILLREDGVCQVCNPAAAALLGIDQRQALGNRFRVQEALGAELVGQLRVLAETGTDQAPPVAARINARHLMVTGATFHRPGSAYSGLMILMRDVSAETEAERLRRDLVGIASHELRTPLAVITTALSLFEEMRLDPTRQEQELFALLTGNAARMRELIDDLLDSTALESGQMQLDLEPLDVGALCADTLAQQQPQAAEAQVAVHYLPPERPAMAMGDARRLRQVLVNLLANAIRYTPTGGQVWLQVQHDGDAIRIDVTNTGVPIATDEQSLVFERFFRGQNTRRNTKGTGLGLPISRAIMERHGGQLWLDRSDEAATIFSCRLPAAER